MKTKKIRLAKIEPYKPNSTEPTPDVSLELNETKAKFRMLFEVNNLLIERFTEKSFFGFNISATTLKSLYFDSCKKKIVALQREVQSTETTLSSNTDLTSQNKIVSTYTETNKQLIEIKDLIEALHADSNITNLFEELSSEQEDFELYVHEVVLKKEPLEDELVGEAQDDFKAIKEQQTFIINDTNQLLKALEIQERLSTVSIEDSIQNAITRLAESITLLKQLNSLRKRIISELPEDDFPITSKNQPSLNFNVYEKEEELEDEIDLVEIYLEEEEEEPVALLQEHKDAENRFVTLLQDISNRVDNEDFLKSSLDELRDIKGLCYETIAATSSAKTTKETRLLSDIKTYLDALAKLETLQNKVARKISDREILLKHQLDTLHRSKNEALDGLKSEVFYILQLITEIPVKELNADDILDIEQARRFCQKSNTIELTTPSLIELEMAQKIKDASSIKAGFIPLLQDVTNKYKNRQDNLVRNITATFTRIGEVTGFHIEIPALTATQTAVETLKNDKDSDTLTKINTLKTLENRYGEEHQRINGIIREETNKRQNSTITREINQLIEQVETAKNSFNNDVDPAAMLLIAFKTLLINERDSYTNLNISLDTVKARIKTEINRNLTPATLENLTTHDAWKITKFFHHIGRLIENMWGKPSESNIKISWFANTKERELATSANALCSSLDNINELQENNLVI